MYVLVSVIQKLCSRLLVYKYTNSQFLNVGLKWNVFSSDPTVVEM